MDTFQERLKCERKRLNLNQEEFGYLGGVSKMTQYFYESARTWPTAEYLESLKSNNVDVGFIVTGVRYVQHSENEQSWDTLKKSFVFVIENFQQNKNEAISPEQLFEAFKKITLATDIINSSETSKIS